MNGISEVIKENGSYREMTTTFLKSDFFSVLLLDNCHKFRDEIFIFLPQTTCSIFLNKYKFRGKRERP